jgi:hypothetical protein
MQRESDLLQRVLLALGSRPDCRLWRNNTGKLPDPRFGRWVSFGLKGSADILGILRGGRFLAIETKTATGLRPEQRAFRDMVTAMGGLYVVARSVDDAVGAVEAALAATARAEAATCSK